MKNNEFKVGDHITVYGIRGIVEKIEKMKEYELSFDGRTIGNGLEVLTDENADDCKRRGYTVIPTGRTATYFTVNFDAVESLRNTSYNHGTYGCLDEFENYGTWK